MFFLIELYPFGRNAFRFELLPVLEALKNGDLAPTRVACSPARHFGGKRESPGVRNGRVVRLMNKYYDLLLVHADPDLVRLEESFGGLNRLRVPVAYTGFVAPGPPPGAGTRLRRRLGLAEGDLLVVASAGGGKVGGPLLEAAVKAFNRLRFGRKSRLHVFTGPFLDKAEFARLRQAAGSRTDVFRFTSEFPAYLAAADLSLSMAGYNTSMNILAAGARALVWPFGQNREQRLRAEELARRGALEVLADEDLNPDALAGRIKAALAQPKPATGTVNLKGAVQTALCLERLAGMGPAALPKRSVMRLCRSGELESRLAAGLERSLNRAGKPVEIFFRADDVAAPGRNFSRMMAIFREHRVPLALGVVPSWLTGPRWSALLHAAGGDLDLWCWHQHGWRHVNHEFCGRKSEFGPARLPERIKDDLEKGRARLAAVMGESFFPVFTPPWNRCARPTLELLAELGYYALSRSVGKGPLPPDNLPEYSVNVDLHTRTGLNPDECFDGLFIQLESAVASGRCGVMIHHQLMDEEAFRLLEALVGAFTRIEGFGLLNLRKTAG